MFKVDRCENRLIRLKQPQLSDLGLRERDHLQEWLAETPDALGEELLIVQKEFDGFADTKERLDLLALDKEGRLVVIENKLDDSGRDVVWQALKYVAYCSSLKKAEIIEIYQQYLDRSSNDGDAVLRICEFLGKEDLDEVILNTGSDQRMILIAANFRKEVTSTVLWLLSHGVRAQCFRFLPYCLNDELLVDIQQIIPTPEAQDYMIRMAAKDSEEKSDQGTRTRTQQLRRAFWSKALEELRNRKVSRFENINPSYDHWLSCATGVPACSFNLIFGKQLARVELILQRGDATDNKWMFDELDKQRESLESRFGSELHWQRLDESKSCRISLSHPFEGFNEENWPRMINWLCEHFMRLEQTFSEPLLHVSNELKSRQESIGSSNYEPELTSDG
ncbi:MAG: DUF4268 domain-containing protein [Gammaproteobacteria bacterium]|nr:DUF4268 domain-containing protein [Gammaproteobacteria bacterium]MYD79505.1 DUF4268 domain-containing protein [Gammaproteobacteria bacterium]